MTDNKPIVGWKLETSYADLPDLLYTKQQPVPVRAPKLIKLNESLAAELGLNAEALRGSDGVDVFAGNQVPDGAEPLAQAYAGHQFAYFNRLGDGRAVLLGEQITPRAERFDIQLKGSGRTPYSRGGDGRAALGPMLREYIISEAMHALGIPTTRSLAVVTTGEEIVRESLLPGAILTRIAASHIRVGTFQFAAQWGTLEELQALADYTIKRHYPDLQDGENRYVSFLREVIKRQAALIAKWQLVGFIHGVMNTDNMAISGESIDYGPCAFMDAYDPATVFSSIDREGRYAYGNQPYIGSWNLARLAEALLPLMDEDEEGAIELAQDALSDFGELYHQHWLQGMRKKLGIFNEEPEDEALIEAFMLLMQRNKADYTNTFRALTMDKPEDTVLFGTPEFAEWQERWMARLGRQEESKEDTLKLMKSSNPAVIPRNHRVEEALEAAEQGNLCVLDNLLAALSNPYAYTEEQADYALLPEDSPRPYRTFCGT
ncbi:YdiU family protein [Paenibacillus glycanilyticus]|uniref:protein adenylyltransferase SelO n=1 Tax=Paenibacillus glycanilyticus TaxID=126569 RepID=UPI002041B842|nr:YdiU family protein [Paenibacillus glycanilyticus]MCM3629643.1 YdiU family protein [Paenibacillus glycanilyticus]